MEKNIEKEIKNATSTLLEIVNQSCYNNISKNLMFILSNINEVEGENSFVQLHNRRRINKLKKPKNFNEIINEVKQFYDEAYDINLFVYKSEKHKTIIEIRYFLKSNLDPDYLKKVTKNPPMLHCKVSIPPYIGTRKEKFDVNWELRYQIQLELVLVEKEASKRNLIPFTSVGNLTFARFFLLFYNAGICILVIIKNENIQNEKHSNIPNNLYIS